MADIITGNPYEGMKRCILNPDKTVAYFCDSNDSNKKADGTTIDWAQVETLGQNLMVQIPKFYAAKKWVPTKNTWVFGASYEPVATADLTLADWEVHPAFRRDQNVAGNVTGNPVEVPFRYVGAAPHWIDGSGRLRSLPGKEGTNFSGDKLYATMFPAALKMGVGYITMDYLLHCAIVHLYLCEFGDPDCYTRFPFTYEGKSDGSDQTGMPVEALGKGNSSSGNIDIPNYAYKRAQYRGIFNFSWTHHLIGFYLHCQTVLYPTRNLITLVIKTQNYGAGADNPQTIVGTDATSTYWKFATEQATPIPVKWGDIKLGNIIPGLHWGTIPSADSAAATTSFKDNTNMVGGLGADRVMATGPNFKGFTGYRIGSGSSNTIYGVTRLCL